MNDKNNIEKTNEKTIFKIFLNISKTLSEMSEHKAALAVFTIAYKRKNEKKIKFSSNEETIITEMELTFKKNMDNEKGIVQRNSNISKEHNVNIRKVNENDLIDYNDYIGGKSERSVFTKKFLRPSRYKKLYNTSGNSILLYGPPGTGKTMFVKSLPSFMRKYKAFEKKINVFAPLPSDLKGKYVGETEKFIKNWFDEAQRSAEEIDGYSILFIDEIETLAMDRSKGSENSQMTTNALIQMMDGVKGYNKVILIGASNIPWDLDSAVLDRFSSKIFIDLPSAQSIYETVYKKLKERVLEPKKGHTTHHHNIFNKIVTEITYLCYVNLEKVDDEVVKIWLNMKNTNWKQIENENKRKIPLSLRSVSRVVDHIVDDFIEEIVLKKQFNQCDLFCEEEIEGCTNKKECNDDIAMKLNINIDMLQQIKYTEIIKNIVMKYKSSTKLEEYKRFITYKNE